MEKHFELVPWAVNTNVYEVNIRQYTKEGTFEAFEKHIDRLANMGVAVLWFMPITPISTLNRKGSLGSYYACSSYTNINPEFGDLKSFKTLVNSAHQKGLKVIIDWVANHTGLDHEWTKIHPDFYKLNHEGKFYDAHGWDDVIDLDYANQKLRVEMIRSMKYWITETDIDGFRCDMAMLTPVDFWHQARESIEPLKKLFWLAELDPLDNSDYMQVFDSAYTWRWMNTAKQCKDEGARHIHTLKEVLFQYHSILPKQTMPSWFTSNHDENSWNGTEYEKYGEMSLPLAVFSCTWQGLPLLYSGQEIPNHKRLAFFDKDAINWDKSIALESFYSKLLNLRKKNKAFNNTFLAENISEINNSVDHHVLSFKRKSGEDLVFIFINFSQYDLEAVKFFTDYETGSYEEVFTKERKSFGTQFFETDLKGWGYHIWVKQ